MSPGDTRRHERPHSGVGILQCPTVLPDLSIAAGTIVLGWDAGYASGHVACGWVCWLYQHAGLYLGHLRVS